MVLVAFGALNVVLTVVMPLRRVQHRDHAELEALQGMFRLINPYI
jgi:hypothetical protein